MSEIFQKIHNIFLSSPSLTWILRGLSLVYSAGISLRLLLYRKGILKVRKLPSPVISVGNIAVGGTGKTPMTLHLAGILKKKGFSPVVLSRGYGGSIEKGKYSFVAGDGDIVLGTPLEVGDEPFMMASRLSFPVVVGRDRFTSGWMAIELLSPSWPGTKNMIPKYRMPPTKSPENPKPSQHTISEKSPPGKTMPRGEKGPLVMILDDGFQHIKLERDINIVLMDCSHPVGNGHLLPAGRLREGLDALKRADAVVFTRCSRDIGHSGGKLPACGRIPASGKLLPYPTLRASGMLPPYPTLQE
ncbi:MAG: tetraacyldisaccharide 4'-kinase [Desulfamplus sp.]|nr:tetraacyldisaccharide 4'-kinase [Desulfamplus sp.]